MKQLIDKSALVAEMERRIDEDYNTGDREKDAVAQGAISSLKYYIEDTLEVYEVEEDDLEAEFVLYLKHKFNIPQEGNKLKTNGWSLSPYELLDIAKHFAKWQKERILNNATDIEVKVDVCGSPYIDFTELYDYDKDIPLAKKGDKVKLVIIGEDKT